MDAHVIGNYSLEAPLGRGGMGLVYRARHLALDKDVAIKFMMPSLSENPEFCARFLLEARRQARLDHPNIVRVFDYGEHEGKNFLVMELLEGETLEDRLARQPILPAEEAVRIISATLSALGEIHGQGFVHRDIKPANIFLTKSGKTKVMDFGITSKISGSTETVTKGMGTPTYYSPEQAEGHKPDARSDVYSVGVVLYEMLAGKPPFVAETPMALLNMHVHKAVPPLPEAVPAQLRRVAMRALAKQPAARFPSAQAMLDALSTRHSVPLPTPTPWKPMAAAATAVLLVLLYVAGVKLHNDQVRERAESLAREAFVEMTHAHLEPARFKAMEALNLDLHNMDARAALGAALVETYNKSNKADDLLAAHKAMESLIGHTPDSAYAYAALGALDFADAHTASITADCEVARNMLEGAKNRDPNMAYVFYKLGMIEKRLGGGSVIFELISEQQASKLDLFKHSKAAEQYFKQAIDRDPHIAWAHTELASQYYDQKRFEESVLAAKGEIESGTPTALTYNYLGMALSEQGKYYKVLGMSLSAQGKKHEKAAEAFQTAIGMDHDSTVGVYHYKLAGELIYEAECLIVDRAKLGEASAELKKAMDNGYVVSDTDPFYKKLAANGFALDLPVKPVRSENALK